jgi:hypothetical protein
MAKTFRAGTEAKSRKDSQPITLKIQKIETIYTLDVTKLMESSLLNDANICIYISFLIIFSKIILLIGH